MLRFTQKNILRIYPKQTRVNSSNYKPMIGWINGAQMVAFNMQVFQYSLLQYYFVLLLVSFQFENRSLWFLVGIREISLADAWDVSS